MQGAGLGQVDHQTFGKGEKQDQTWKCWAGSDKVFSDV